MNKRYIKGPEAGGFTLIELLIVMAILGVLAVVVLVAINPVQQLARTRDAGRKSGVSQVGRALEAFYTSHGGKYLYGRTAGSNPGTNCNTDGNQVFSDADDWLTCLVNTGEISTEPGLINYSVAGTGVCTIGAQYSSEQNGLCYTVSSADDEAVVYAGLESDSERSKCPDSGGPFQPFFVWSTRDGRGGLVCIAGINVPAPGAQNWNPQQ